MDNADHESALIDQIVLSVGMIAVNCLSENMYSGTVGSHVIYIRMHIYMRASTLAHTMYVCIYVYVSVCMYRMDTRDCNILHTNL